MDKSLKPLSRLLLVISLVCGFFLLISMNLCSVQASTDVNELPTPSVPEFTLKLEAHPYYVTPTYRIDPYTGENTTKEEGYTVENKTIIIAIKNQAFISSFNGTNYYFYYNVREKGHFENEWKELYSYSKHKMYPSMSKSEYTVITISADEYPSGGQVDFQVEAILYHDALVRVYDHFYDFVGHLEPGKALYDKSGWSETQTVTISNFDSTTNSETPDQLNLILAGALMLIPIAAGLGLLIYISKRKHSD